MSRTPSPDPGDGAAPRRDRFEEVFARADTVPGWLTRDQARTLFDAALDLPPGGRIIEIGSHQGRSTVVLASAREDVEVVAIDPFIAAASSAVSAPEGSSSSAWSSTAWPTACD